MQPWVYFLLIAAFFFLMMRGGCGSHVMGHGHHHHDGDQPTGPIGSVPATGPTQVRDPVCGMTIDRATAKTSALRGIVYYFCSEKCRSQFEASPETYAVATPQRPEQQHG
jgi:YHS domain-containing protein